ncbi:XRE family transcriptional regulator [soil metagenome]|jgi:transcriptional regulator with XRE-family HTH domain|nr:XRE family transcriptional regulator [Gemmatimonadota bacterium]
MPRKKWSEIRAKAAPETLEAAERKREGLLAVMELNELRRARNLTQEELANRLGVRQTNVSRMERRGDMHISTLREVIEAMGGELEITARFPDGEYRIDQFARVES